jgi:integrase
MSHKKSLQTDKERLRWLNNHLAYKMLDEIDKKCLEDIKQAKLLENRSNATVNRHLAIISSILHKAKNEWEWIDSVPVIKKLREPDIRIRWLTHEEADILLAELPDHSCAMAGFTLATGLRESNVTGLRWDQFDMQRRCAWIHADQAKSGKSIAVPLNDDAYKIIKAQIGQHLTHVFTYDGHPVIRANNHAWKKALKRAGIENCRWHDLRHTWASRHIQNRTPLHMLKELGGWSDLSMVLRYAHLSSKHLHEYAGNLSVRVFETNLLHRQNS